MSSIQSHPLLETVAAHCERAKISQSAFGTLAVGDPKFVFDLEKGREPRRRTVERVMDFIATGKTWDELKPRQDRHTNAGADK